MVKGPLPAMLNVMVCVPGAEFAKAIALRSDPPPLLLVLVTSVGTTSAWMKQDESSDVLPKASVAVAVTYSPGARGGVSWNVCVPPALTESNEPASRSLRLLPLVSHAALAKNCTVY